MKRYLIVYVFAKDGDILELFTWSKVKTTRGWLPRQLKWVTKVVQAHHGITFPKLPIQRLEEDFLEGLKDPSSRSYEVTIYQIPPRSAGPKAIGTQKGGVA